MQKAGNYTQKRQKLGSKEQRLRLIGEILGLLEETYRDKNWIYREIKNHHQNFHLDKKSSTSSEMLSKCPQPILTNLLHTLKGDDIASPEKINTDTKRYHWFFIDIVAGSDPSITTRVQVSKITVLNELISKTESFRKRDPVTTIILPTGDGMAIGFADRPESPVLLAIELYKAVLQYNRSRRSKEKLLIRVGLESGPVFFVKDLEGKDNVWGRGILTTRRVMDSAGDMQIFVSSRIAEELLRSSPQFKPMLHPAGIYRSPYGERLQLYNLYGDGFGRKDALINAKKVAQSLSRDVKTATNFLFKEIVIILQVSDVQTMQTHHIWTWDMVNISKEQRANIFYYLDGHFPQSLRDMGVKVSDSKGNTLTISDIITDKQGRKEFLVKLAKPILPKERVSLKLQYDCPLTDRVFNYRFPSGAQKFSYTCFLPKEISLKNRILKVDLGTGYKVHATPPSKLTREQDQVVIVWEKKNIIPQDAYRFEW